MLIEKWKPKEYGLEPKGLLVAIGGNEDKETDLTILTKVISLVHKDKIAIEIITTASEYPQEVARGYQRVFSKAPHHEVYFMHMDESVQAKDEQFVKRIKAADIVFFTGGDQLRLTSILAGSPIEAELLRKYHEEECVIAGSSAGASAMSKIMIRGGDHKVALKKGGIGVYQGFGFMENAIIDTHFVERGRFSRLIQMISMNPESIGIGIGEDSALIIEGGCLLQAIGSGITVILDGEHLGSNNYKDIAIDESIAVENLILHTLIDGYGYDLCQKKYLMPKDLIKMKKRNV